MVNKYYSWSLNFNLSLINGVFLWKIGNFFSASRVQLFHQLNFLFFHNDLLNQLETIQIVAKILVRKTNGVYTLQKHKIRLIRHMKQSSILQCSMCSTAAAAAKSLQSCPTLCDPTEGNQPGSPVPGILQARTLEWVAISFSNAWKWKVKVKSLSRVRLFPTTWNGAYRAPPPMGFSRQCALLEIYKARSATRVKENTVNKQKEKKKDRWLGGRWIDGDWIERDRERETETQKWQLDSWVDT